MEGVRAAIRACSCRATPDETGGDYWRVLPEGMIEGYDGVTIADEPEHEALDFGANFPGDLGETPSQTDGPYPDVGAGDRRLRRRDRAPAEHRRARHLPHLRRPGADAAGEHRREAARAGSRRVRNARRQGGGADRISRDVVPRLRSVDREGHIPSAFGWLYNRRGIYSFITEFWNPLTAAGITLENTTASAWLWGYHPVEDELKLLRWSDQKLDGDGFVAWKRFDHPQLGPVEIGGFDLIRYWYNVPFDRLEKEVAPHSEWLI